MMSLSDSLKKFWRFLKEDTWQSWIVSIILVVVIIKFIFFPLLSLATGTSLPLVVVESCSMYHESNFDSWWSQNGQWYEDHNITKSEFESYSLNTGLNKGDIVLVTGYNNYTKGNIIIFATQQTQYPIIHRVISLSPLETKGDHNPGQIMGIENNIDPNQVIGHAVLKIPALGWIKLIFFEPFKDPSQRGLCH